MAMDGIWTFIIPARQGGGVIVARNGKLYGGDIGYFFSGTYTETGDAVKGTIAVSRFNDHVVLQSVWGDNAAQFEVSFQGRQRGDDTVTGQISRAGMPGAFPLTLTRRADVP
jgi:hypothetical protein